MAKNSVADWDPVAANNTDIAGTPILGTAAVQNFDNAFRTLMAQVAAAKLPSAAYAQTLTDPEQEQARANISADGVISRTVVAAGATEIDIALPAGYDAFNISAVTLLVSEPTTVNVRVGNPAILTASNYYFTRRYTGLSANTLAGDNSISAAWVATGLAEPGAGGGASLEMTLYPGSLQAYPVLMSQAAYYRLSGPIFDNLSLTGMYTLPARMSVLRLYPSAGTFQGGIVILKGGKA